MDNNMKKILNKIKTLDLYDTFIELNDREFKELNDIYGVKWYLNFFISEHIHTQINLITKNPQKKNKIISKMGKEWYNLHIDNSDFQDKLMFSYQYIFKKEKERNERKQKLEEILKTYTLDNFSNKTLQ